MRNNGKRGIKTSISLGTTSTQAIIEIIHEILGGPSFTKIKDELGIDYARPSDLVRGAVAYFLKYPPTIEQIKAFSVCRDNLTTEVFLKSIIKERNEN